MEPPGTAGDGDLSVYIHRGTTQNLSVWVNADMAGNNSRNYPPPRAHRNAPKLSLPGNGLPPAKVKVKVDSRSEWVG